MWAWQTVGVNMPHNADDQRQATKGTPTPQSGDLVGMWFPNSRGIARPHWSHVGLFVAKAGSSVRVLDTRNPHDEPVAYRVQDLSSVMGYGRP